MTPDELAEVRGRFSSAALVPEVCGSAIVTHLCDEIQRCWNALGKSRRSAKRRRDEYRLVQKRLATTKSRFEEIIAKVANLLETDSRAPGVICAEDCQAIANTALAELRTP